MDPFPGLKLVTAPTEEPITLADAKLHLRVTHTEEDGRIASMIEAARRRCEAETRRALVTQTWDLTLPFWPGVGNSVVTSGPEWPWMGRGGRIILPKPPLQSITSITYLTPAGSTLAVTEGTDFKVRTGSPGVVSLKSGKSWPSVSTEDDPIMIRFVAGYGLGAAVPDSLVQGMLLLIGSMYEHREDLVVGQTPAMLPDVVEALWATEAWGFYG